jgi:hypothetical protein
MTILQSKKMEKAVREVRMETKHEENWKKFGKRAVADFHNHQVEIAMDMLQRRFNRLSNN